MRSRILIILFSLLQYCCYSHVVSGHVYDAANGESMIGVTIFDSKTYVGGVTNEFGFYSLSLKNDTVNLVCSYLGYSDFSVSLILRSDTTIDIRLTEDVTEFEEITIKVKKERLENIANENLGSIVLDPKNLNSTPSIAGEVDALKVMQLMPGVQRGQEGTNGIFIRGGSIDQNLILLDDAPVYNAGHILGFFSIFNNEALKNVKLVKGGFDAEYGGRLSSVIDIRTRDGNMEEHTVQGGMGLLSSRISVEGPIIKDTLSYTLSARRSYIDQLSKLTKFEMPYYFYDLNGKVNYRVNPKTRIYLSGYLGNDVLSINPELEDVYGDLAGFGFNVLNNTATLRINREHSQKLFANYSIIYTGFQYNVEGAFDGNEVLVRSQINDFGVKADYDYYLNNEHSLKFGFNTTQHVFIPNFINTSGEITEFLQSQSPDPINMMEFAGYVSDRYKVNERLNINVGVRFSGASVQDTIYHGLEPRFSLNYGLTSDLFFKTSYTRMKQYMHLVSSSTIALPTDLWYPVTKKVDPLNADQYSVGLDLALRKIDSKLSVEGYFKEMRQLIEYREGAQLLLNNNFEEELLSGIGHAYGAEFLLQRFKGRFNGWIGYTLSWSTRNFEELNNGKEFFSKFDRRHDVSIVGNYMITPRVKFTAVWIYLSGARFTAQIGQFLMPNSSLTDVDVLPIYSDRNAVKMSPTHRLDVNLSLINKAKSKIKYEFNLGVYNLYNRTSPFLVEIAPSNEGSLVYQQPGLFGLLPYFSLNFKI